jgi:hypothetical protein
VERLERVEVSPDYAPLLGRAPVWFGPYLDVDEGRSILRIPADAPRTPYGWRVKFLWIVDLPQAAPVTLHGGEVSGPRALWIEPESAEQAATEAALDPGPPGSGSGFKEFPSYIYLPAAGCYFLQAAWQGGSWRIDFAAGR